MTPDINEIQDFYEIDEIKRIAVQALRRGYREINNLAFLLEPRLDNGVMTSSLCDALEDFCRKSKNWFYLVSNQNNYLIYKNGLYACVFKIRNSNPIDTNNIRNNLSNGRINLDQNANIYIANDVSRYLAKPRNGRLKVFLEEYQFEDVQFHHLVWCLSENEIDRVHVGVTYTKDYTNNGKDLYLRLISDNIIEEKTNESVNDDLAATEDNTDQKANIIKPKRSKDDQRKQSV